MVRHLIKSVHICSNLHRSGKRECDSDKQFWVKIPPTFPFLFSPLLTHFPFCYIKKTSFTPTKYLIFQQFQMKLIGWMRIINENLYLKFIWSISHIQDIGLLANSKNTLNEYSVISCLKMHTKRNVEKIFLTMLSLCVLICKLG